MQIKWITRVQIYRNVTFSWRLLEVLLTFMSFQNFFTPAQWQLVLTAKTRFASWRIPPSCQVILPSSLLYQVSYCITLFNIYKFETPQQIFEAKISKNNARYLTTLSKLTFPCLALLFWILLCPLVLERCPVID